jgi:acyl-CoA oxidase
MAENKHLKQMSTDMAEARSKATFKTDGMTTLLRGGPEAIAKLDKIRAIAEQEPLFDKSKIPYQSRQDVKNKENYVCVIITNALF